MTRPTTWVFWTVLSPSGELCTWPKFNHTKKEAYQEAKELNQVNPQPIGKRYRAIQVKVERIRRSRKK